MGGKLKLGGGGEIPPFPGFCMKCCLQLYAKVKKLSAVASTLYLLPLTVYLVNLVMEPDPSHGEVQSGHPSTFKLSPSRRVHFGILYQCFNPFNDLVR